MSTTSRSPVFCIDCYLLRIHIETCVMALSANRGGFGQLARAKRCSLDGIHQRSAETAAFEGMETSDGGAARAGNAIFEQTGVFVRFQHHARRSHHRLGR